MSCLYSWDACSFVSKKMKKEWIGEDQGEFEEGMEGGGEL